MCHQRLNNNDLRLGGGENASSCWQLTPSETAIVVCVFILFISKLLICRRIKKILEIGTMPPPQDDFKMVDPLDR